MGNRVLGALSDGSLQSRIEQHAHVSGSRCRAFDRGDGQPNLSTFIALSWGRSHASSSTNYCCKLSCPIPMRRVISLGIG